MSTRAVAVVTGASRGIGRAVAIRLAATHEIVALARDGEALARLTDEIAAAGGSCRAVTADLMDGVAAARALEGVEANVLVNNAGVAIMRPFLELTAEEWHRMVDVNFNALFHVTRAVLPGMVARGRGDVVIVGSLAGRNTFVGGTCYAGTKHAVMGFAESLMLEVRDRGVRVAVVMPGSVATGLFPPGTDTSWMMRPEEVADTVAQVVEAPRDVLMARIELRVASPGQRR